MNGQEILSKVVNPGKYMSVDGYVTHKGFDIHGDLVIKNASAAAKYTL